MDESWVNAAYVVVGVPAALLGYIWGSEQLLRAASHSWQRRIRPWIWLLPAIVLLFVFLVLPTVQTIAFSLQDRTRQSFVGLANYRYFVDTGDTLAALRNNGVWLVGLTAVATGGGLVIAILVDRVRYEAFAKSIIFLPLAISFVGAGVIWRFMLDFRPAGAAQTGTLNGLLDTVGIAPVPWLINPPGNTMMLIVVAVWIWTGFCMVILSAALKSINPELLEAARVDGAGEGQIFRSILLPLLAPTLAVVATTMVITSLKAFDIVYVMTNGSFDTEVIANRMYKELFSFGQPGRASAVAVVLLVLVIPVMAVNIRRFRDQEAMR